MPTVMFNTALSLLPDRSLSVRGPDTLAVVSPMFNEETGAPRALASLLEQSEPFDELVVSINGGSDDTARVVRATLAGRGFGCVGQDELPDVGASVQRWLDPALPTRVILIDHVWPVSKADSINLAIAAGLVTAHRVLVVDGDTVFDRGFVGALKDNFYRLKSERTPPRFGGARRRYVLEDVALQSGAVRSLSAAAGRPQAAFISAGRDAEYAFSSVIRSGQCATLARGPMLGRSRLFTVVGCGFVARRDSFPIPNDTQTEDHDFTLATQNDRETEVVTDAAALDARGFRVVVDGRERPLGRYVGSDARIVVKKGASARFVSRAVMYTEDPPHVSGFLRQVERWNGGAIENALKRLWGGRDGAALRPNVAFALLGSQVENLFGLLLMVLLPVLLGIQYGLPGARAPVASLAAWSTLDLLVSALIVHAGAVRLGAAAGGRGIGLWLAASRLTLVGILPLLALRWLGALSYLTAASRVLPAFVRARAAARAAPGGSAAAAVAGGSVAGAGTTTGVHTPPGGRVTVTWDRPSSRAKPRAHARTAGVAATLLLTSAALFAGVAHLAHLAYGAEDGAWYHTYAAPRLEQDDHLALPLRAVDRTFSPLTYASAALEPLALEQLALEKPALEPAAVERLAGEPVAVEPEARDRLAVEPVALGPTALQPVAVAQVAVEPVARARLAVEPVALEPLAVANVAVQLAAVDPVAGGDPVNARPDAPEGLSQFCQPAFVAGAAAAERRLTAAQGDDAPRYRPLSPWGLLVLARLAPLLSHLEEAATAYDLDAAFLLRVLLNESYLDPLAVGPTGDLGLAQVTSDALTLLRSVSTAVGSPLSNANLFGSDFSVYDPEFSLCAGAAKLAWASSQPFGEDERVAYALYINPLHGARRGHVAETHLKPVAAMVELRPLVELLAATVAAYRADPDSVTADERALLDVSAAVAAGALDVPGAYAAVSRLIEAMRIDDRPFYRAIMERLYGAALAGTGDGATGGITVPPPTASLARR